MMLIKLSNDVDKIVNQVFRQLVKSFSEFDSDKYAYLRLRSHPDYTECKMISTRQPRIHRFVVQTNQDNPIITEEKISIDSKTVKEKGI